MRKMKLFFTSLLLLVANLVFAQNIRVSGTVKDSSSGEPVPFAAVHLKGTMSGVSTDAHGDYSFEVPQGSVLVFSSIGYKNQEVKIEKASRYDVLLLADAEYLEETIVVAYGTADKKSFTGSAEVIKSDKLKTRTVANVTKALDGMAPGVISTSGSGQPGAGSSIVIRGWGSLNASNTPLYVVDGVPFDGTLNSINPNDIESMTIIKDASAGALYGSRGANGVVLINTKKGREGTFNVQLKGVWSWASRAIDRYETMDSYAWTEDLYSIYSREAIRKGYQGNDIHNYAIDQMINGADRVFGKNEEYNPFSRSLSDLIDPGTGKIKNGTSLKWNEDWLDAATAKNPLRQEYTLSVDGGNARTKYMFSLGYLNQDGLVTTTSFRRYSARANVDSQIKAWLKAGLNVNFANNTTNSTMLGSSSSSSSAYSNVFYSCANMAPIYPLYLKDNEGQTILDDKGNKQYDWGSRRPAGANKDWNTIAVLLEDKYRGVTDNLSGRTYIDLGGMKTGVLQGLKFSVNFGFDYVNSTGVTFYNPEFGNAASVNGRLGKDSERLFSYTFNQLLTYNRTFNGHNIDILLGHEYYDYNTQYIYGLKAGSAADGMMDLDGFVTTEELEGYTNNYRVDSYLVRLNYGYADKYYISGSYRRDASSRFHKDNRWGDFWSVGASWRISQETFLQNVKWLDNLTIKASYGVQGNDNVGSLYAWQSLYNLGFANGGMGGALISKLETKDLKWEKNSNLNVGLDASVFNRLSLSLEYYRRKTDDMLMEYPLPFSSGFSSYFKNAGSMLNSGVEFTLSGDIFAMENFNWNMTIMGSTVDNKVLKLTENGEPIRLSTDYIVQEGAPINSFYLPKGAGVDPATGDKLYEVWTENEAGERTYSVTNDKNLANNCREIRGSRIPDFFGSINNTFKFFGVDLGIMCTYSIGGKILDGVYSSYLYNTYPGTAAHIDRAKAWQKPGDITSIPRIDMKGSTDILNTDNDLVDASYFAIKSITLGYSLPKKWMDRIKMNSIRVFLNGDNLLMCAARKGLDPQYNFSGGTGYSYTPERTISVGLEINF